MLRCLPWVVLAHLAMKASSPAHATGAQLNIFSTISRGSQTFNRSWSNNLRQITQSFVPRTWAFQKVEELPFRPKKKNPFDTFRALEDRKHHCHLVHASLADGVHRPRVVRDQGVGRDDPTRLIANGDASHATVGFVALGQELVEVPTVSWWGCMQNHTIIVLMACTIFIQYFNTSMIFACLFFSNLQDQLIVSDVSERCASKKGTEKSYLIKHYQW